MNVLEAIRSGRRYKRKDWTTWTEFCGNRIEQPGATLGLLQASMTYHDLLAEDWEIEPEPPISLTKDRFMRLVGEALKAQQVMYYGPRGLRAATERDILDTNEALAYLIRNLFPNKEPTL